MDTKASRHLLFPVVLLRLEGAMLLAASAVLYARAGGGWLLFFALLLAPDLSMVGYLAGPRVGAAAYNLAHSYPLPAALALIGLLGSAPLATLLTLVWLAHIGMDRLAGYGLKLESGFKDTHLGTLGG